MKHAELIQLRDLLRELVMRDMKIRYEGTVLGFAWTLVNPLLFVGVFYFLFNVVLDVGTSRFTSYTLIGMLVYMWFQSSVVEACSIARSNRDLVRRPQFKLAVLPLVSVMGNLIHLLLAFPILAVILLFDGSQPSVALLALPIVIIVQFVLTVGLAYFGAAVSVLYRDVGYIIDVLLKVFFFLTPIFYEVSKVPPQFQTLYSLNPLVPLLDAFRNPLIHGLPPSWNSLLSLGLIALLLVIAGYKLFVKISHRFAEEL
ncbi:MAG: ABC transporter permease [Gammaproteobacteria bacterium]|nr:ABC transporter permease [Gammaproteobacteria bacterium]MDH3405961.1 ABC transporter permease [Gammaproteobacteria bacterium]